MILSQKSINFAKKILKHNPITSIHQHNHEQHSHNHEQHSQNHQQHSHNHEQHSHNHQKHSQNHSQCPQNKQQQIKPYLHVHDHRKQRQIYQKPTKQKLQCMRSFKTQGNEHFRSKRYQQASHYYNKVIIFSDYTFPQQIKQQKQMDQLVQQSNCNLGMSLVKMGQTQKAGEYFVQAIKGPVEKVVIKSLYWLVKGNIGEGEFQKAQQYLGKLKNFGQLTREETSELDLQIKKDIDKCEKKRKAVFGQMLNTQATNQIK